MLNEAMTRCNKAILIDSQHNYILTRLILWYTDSKIPVNKKQLLEQIIVNNLPKEGAQNIMKTIADSYIEEGFNKGIEQGIEKGIQQGIQKGKAEGRVEGKAEGIAEGIVKGITEGRAEGIKKVARNLLSQKIAVETISIVTGLTVEEILKLKI